MICKRPVSDCSVLSMARCSWCVKHLPGGSFAGHCGTQPRWPQRTPAMVLPAPTGLLLVMYAAPCSAIGAPAASGDGCPQAPSGLSRGHCASFPPSVKSMADRRKSRRHSCVPVRALAAFTGAGQLACVLRDERPPVADIDRWGAGSGGKRMVGHSCSCNGAWWRRCETCVPCPWRVQCLTLMRFSLRRGSLPIAGREGTISWCACLCSPTARLPGGGHMRMGLGQQESLCPQALQKRGSHCLVDSCFLSVKRLEQRAGACGPRAVCVGVRRLFVPHRPVSRAVSPGRTIPGDRG